MVTEGVKPPPKPPGPLKRGWDRIGKVGHGAVYLLGVGASVLGIWAAVADPPNIPTPGHVLSEIEDWFDPPPSNPVEHIVATVRHNQPEWGSHTFIEGGINPSFDVQIDYENTSGVDLSNVVLSLDENGTAKPIKGTVFLMDDDHPRGIAVDDDMLSAKGLNIGNPKHPVYVRATYYMPTSQMGCGQHTTIFTASVRTPSFHDDKPIPSQEAVVTYDNVCPPPGPIGGPAMSPLPLGPPEMSPVPLGPIDQPPLTAGPSPSVGPSTKP
ncbi:hypothetical protein FZI85_27265 [Mycobacterium sp. CBMA293]|uniref:Uncharacterized protein n=1 Tax=Mycolicibacterium sp. CBMA 213 TaxID=1968788 RepID=A0A1S6GKJ5_9MYCO|nr:MULTISPECIES: hypothetical protein [unclassified Mycolicibacterium]AQS22387.1 hypothetical protein pCBMA213_2_00023 [Mycolicibacterium sp. CBMA 213]MUL48448.1 hypothetical protein [Mycolicibacterium sp. CBMA 360]MUL62306.1 hypothetical protein [Mycolicibacterium sp. CBMA 335]MUM14706.1 hypothetical protein [Mycolicibacterium sp. CBMA 293]MUM32151.1 hypothetical protein [Mycolicibacterium sp. CBMA 361]